PAHWLGLSVVVGHGLGLADPRRDPHLVQEAHLSCPSLLAPSVAPPPRPRPHRMPQAPPQSQADQGVTMPVGISTKLGVVFAVVAALKPVVDQIVALVENTSAHWSTGDKVSLI